MENEIKVVRHYYGMPVYGVSFDDGKAGGYVELKPGTEPSFDTVLAAILNETWPLERRMNLTDMQKYRPDDIDTVKASNAYSFDFEIAVDAAKAAMVSFAASQAME